MKIKNIIIPVLCGLMFSSCAGLSKIAEEVMPLSKRLISENSVIRQAAVAEFIESDEDKKKKTVLEIIEMFAMEKDEAKRKRMLSVLIDLKTGSYAVIPLLQAAGRNVNITSAGDIVEAIKKMKPSAEDINRMGVMFMDGADIIKKIVMHFLGRF